MVCGQLANGTWSISVILTFEPRSARAFSMPCAADSMYPPSFGNPGSMTPTLSGSTLFCGSTLLGGSLPFAVAAASDLLQAPSRNSVPVSSAWLVHS